MKSIGSELDFLGKWFEFCIDGFMLFLGYWREEVE